MPTGLTSTIVVNNALEFIAAQTQITALNDGSPAANAANVIYAQTVNLMLRLLEPDFARLTAGLVLTGAVPQPPFSYEYLYPNDCLRLLQVRPPSGSYDINDPQPVRANVMADQIATGSITFPSNPLNGATITLNGRTLTFVNDGSGWPNNLNNDKINIGGNTGGTLSFLADPSLGALTTGTFYLADPLLNVATYQEPGTGNQLLVTFKGFVGAGLNYTLAASAATVSGPNLTAQAIKAIQTTQANALATYISSSVTEVVWDSAFTDAVIRRLANPLAMALSGRPDFARELLEEANAASQAAEMTDESAVRH